jgi:hypothetical protein
MNSMTFLSNLNIHYRKHTFFFHTQIHSLSILRPCRTLIPILHIYWTRSAKVASLALSFLYLSPLLKAMTYSALHAPSVVSCHEGV